MKNKVKKLKSKIKVTRSLRSTFDMNLSDIVSVERTKYVMNKNVLDIKLKDGTEYKFSISKKVELWLEEIKKHISA